MKINARNARLAWKYRRALWKYRGVIRHRREIGAGLAIAAIVGAVVLLGGAGNPARKRLSAGPAA